LTGHVRVSGEETLQRGMAGVVNDEVSGEGDSSAAFGLDPGASVDLLQIKLQLPGAVSNKIINYSTYDSEGEGRSLGIMGIWESVYLLY
jgi:hypothetical protein